MLVVETSAPIRRGPFVNRRESKGREGRLADQLSRRDLAILHELGYLPLVQAGGQLLFRLISRLPQSI